MRTPRVYVAAPLAAGRTLDLPGDVQYPALPWIGVLSAHYGEFTFSTSARVARAIAGPPDTARYHPTMRTLHTPPPARPRRRCHLSAR